MKCSMTLHWPHYEKVTYGVYMAAKKLKHYFQGHPIKVVATAPLAEIVGSKDANGPGPCVGRLLSHIKRGLYLETDSGGGLARKAEVGEPGSRILTSSPTVKVRRRMKQRCHAPRQAIMAYVGRVALESMMATTTTPPRGPAQAGGWDDAYAPTAPVIGRLGKDGSRSRPMRATGL
ncbi:hypothetical protein QYE76_005850 [Lolium multiflorum]|uniref:Uncharacterized protein n=1 Tax=Lolium multiflorum TaxID=4521 RepID=A0AAD8RTR8_LOLMU|nr:hypothetical protein QYE76_005850 [Lolium multiflorum]